MTEKERDFNRILENFRDRIFRLCCNYTGNSEDRLDLFHDVIVRIWDKMDSFQERSSVSTWIFRLTVNSGIDFLRKKKVRDRVLVHSVPDELTIKDGSVDIERNFVVSEQTAFLYQCLDRLSFLEKTIISLYFEDLSYEEISNIIGISETNVGVKIHRIKKILEGFFQEFSR